MASINNSQEQCWAPLLKKVAIALLLVTGPEKVAITLLFVTGP
jgi:hypothetical protein